MAVTVLHLGLISVLLKPAEYRTATPPRALTVSLVAPPPETKRDRTKPKPVPAQSEPRPRSDASPAPRPDASPSPTPLLVVERPQQTTPPAVANPTRTAIPDAPAEPAPAPSSALSPRAAPAPQVATEDPPAPTAASAPTPPHPADYLNNPTPPYPALSKRLGETGTVRLNVLINPDGSVARLELARSSGHPRLDRSAMETVQRHWQFEPARQRGQPVSAWVIVPIEFTLRS